MTTVNRIFQLIKENNLTAKEFANKVGVSQGNITDWKTGRANPSVESLKKIANAFNIQLEWLTGDSEYRTKEEELNILIDFAQSKSGLNRNIVSNSLGKGLNLSQEENEIFIKTLASLSDMVENNNADKFNLFDSIQDLDNGSKKRIINAITIVTSSQAHVFSRLATVYNKNHIEKLEELDNLIENDFKDTNSQLYDCPVYGRISAGIPNWAEECLESYLPLDPNLMNINNPEECFFLRVNGESMNKLVRNGAYALIRKQDVVENGDIAVVLVDNYDATLKKFTKHGDVVVLEPMSDDPNFQTQIYDKNTDIKILGKYLGKFELNN